MQKIGLKTVFKRLIRQVESDEKDYEILFRRQKQAKFHFRGFDVATLISLEADSVTVKTESLFNVPKDHPASHAIKRTLEGRDFYTRINPADGLVLFLSFSIDENGHVTANGRSLGPFFEELIHEMRGMIDAIRFEVMEKFPYLAGQGAVRIGDEIVVVVAESDPKTIQSVISTVITKPIEHKFNSIFHEIFFGATTSYDDDRLLPNFFYDGKGLQFFTPKRRLIEKRDNISKYETIGTEKVDSTPFFEFIRDLSGRMQEVPIGRNSLCHTILLNIKRILDDVALIGTPDGEVILLALNSDIRDHHRYASENDVVSAITEDDVKTIAQWRELIGNAILFGKYQERVTKARFAARSLEKMPKTLGVEKRRVNRVGSGFSVYISPIEAQVCNLGREVSIELVEEGPDKYILVRKFPN